MSDAEDYVIPTGPLYTALAIEARMRGVSVGQVLREAGLETVVSTANAPSSGAQDVFAALDHLDSLYYSGEPGGMSVRDYQAAMAAIRAATLAAARSSPAPAGLDVADTRRAVTSATQTLAMAMPVILAVRDWRDTPRTPTNLRLGQRLEQAILDAIGDFDELARLSPPVDRDAPREPA